MISVIISAHNRKEYLLEAIKSVVNQTLDPKNYEIIVVKNFKDKTVDEYINAEGIFSIFKNFSVYYFLLHSDRRHIEANPIVFKN